jgi:hypothetical protein
VDHLGVCCGSGKKEGNHSRIVPFTKVRPEGEERLVASWKDLLAQIETKTAALAVARSFLPLRDDF